MGSTGFTTLSTSRLGSVHRRKRVRRYFGTSVCQCFPLSCLVATFGLEGFLSDLTIGESSDFSDFTMEQGSDLTSNLG